MKSSHFKFIVPTILVLILVISVFKVPLGKIDKQRYLQKSYSANQEYNIILTTNNGLYEGLLGEDHERIYMDIFRDGYYFGGSYFNKDRHDSMSVYQFRQYETLLGVFGYNPDSKFSSYELKIYSVHTEPLSIVKEIKNSQYVLDIYLLDTRYSPGTDLELVKEE